MTEPDDVDLEKVKLIGEGQEEVPLTKVLKELEELLAGALPETIKESEPPSDGEFKRLPFPQESEMRKLLKDVWKELQKWVNEKKFDPQSEADIQSFLYHSLIKRLGTAKGLVCAPHPHKSNQADLGFENRLFVENKHILRSGIRSPARWKLRTRIVEADVQKLAEIKKTYPHAAVALTIFAESWNKKQDEHWYALIKRVCDKSRILILTAWKETI
jgi:hypothetical protein